MSLLDEAVQASAYLVVAIVVVAVVSKANERGQPFEVA